MKEFKTTRRHEGEGNVESRITDLMYQVTKIENYTNKTGNNPKGC